MRNAWKLARFSISIVQAVCVHVFETSKAQAKPTGLPQLLKLSSAQPVNKPTRTSLLAAVLCIFLSREKKSNTSFVTNLASITPFHAPHVVCPPNPQK